MNCLRKKKKLLDRKIDVFIEVMIICVMASFNSKCFDTKSIIHLVRSNKIDQFLAWDLSKKVNQMTWASFLSLSTSSSTEETITPAFLLGGSVTWTTSISDLISTFKSCGVNFFMTFDFAFIMLGRVAYLGWFSLKSVLQDTKR